MPIAPRSAAYLAAILCTTLPAFGFSQSSLDQTELVVHTQIKKLALMTSLQQLSSSQHRRQEWRNAAGHSDIRLQLRHGGLDYHWRGDTPSRIDGSLTGLRLSRDFYAAPSCSGNQQAGFTIGADLFRGDSSALPLGEDTSVPAGENRLQSHFISAYFSDYRNSGRYLDLEAKLAYLRTDSRSGSGNSSARRGAQIALSAEAGFDMALSEHYSLEPQGQLIANYTSLSTFSAGGYHLDTDVTPELNLRLGVRAYSPDSPHFIFANYWYTLNGDDDLYSSDGLKLQSPRGARWLELGLGLHLLTLPSGDLSLEILYRDSADDRDWSDLSANLGLNWAW